MKSHNKRLEVQEYFQKITEVPVTFDENQLEEAYKTSTENQSVAIKLLTIFGGVMSSLSFLGFLFIAGLYDSTGGLLLFGSLFLIGSLLLTKGFDRVITRTVCVSLYLMSFILLGMGLDRMQISEDMTAVLFIAISLATMTFVQQYILAFVAVLVFNGSIMFLIYSNKLLLGVELYVSLLAFGIVGFMLWEAKVLRINQMISRLYEPMKTGLMLSLIGSLFILGVKHLFPEFVQFVWIPSVVFIACIAFLISRLLINWQIEKQSIIGILAIVTLALLPTIFSSAISGSLLIILLCFQVNYKTGFAIGILAFIYFIGQYYYDLNFTLLTKSIILFSSGLLLILLYFLVRKKLV